VNEREDAGSMQGEKESWRKKVENKEEEEKGKRGTLQETGKKARIL